jgi:hypothetical protein
MACCVSHSFKFEVISSHWPKQRWIGRYLFFLGCAIWYGASRMTIPVPITWQPPFIAGYAILAAAVTIVLWYNRPVAKAGGIRVPILNFLKDQKLWGRIGLFEGIFIAVLAFDHWGSTILPGNWVRHLFSHSLALLSSPKARIPCKNSSV